jgi:hypothetical protein
MTHDGRPDVVMAGPEATRLLADAGMNVTPIKAVRRSGE